MFGWITGLFSGGSSIAATILIYVLVFGAGSASGAFVMHKMDNGSYQTLVAAQQHSLVLATQKAAAIQKATDKVSLDAAVAEAKAQQQIIVQHEFTTQEVIKYVPVRTACISYGVVRLLVAAGVGADPSNLNTAAGKPDGACAPVDARAFVASLLDAFYGAKANGEQ
ncbi:MAG TPA: hypothetical protein VMV19_17815, partial [Xanthobacteraceae bacterium]|nr:hypothetical protein [Xanthobacteraceae bacterium]